MDWEAAIERNRAALLRIVAALFAMAGLAEGRVVPALPRQLRNHVLRILRPAESAVRRLILIAARDLRAPPATVRSGRQSRPIDNDLSIGAPNARSNSEGPIAEELRGGTNNPAIAEQIRLGRERIRRMETGQSAGIVYRPVNLGLARWADPKTVSDLMTRQRRGADSGLPLATGDGVEPNGGTDNRIPAFPLLDPLKRFGTTRVRYGKSIPRITDILGHTGPRENLEPPQPSPDDPISARRLCLRLLALKRALDDIPGQAQRLARWRARRSSNSKSSSGLTRGPTRTDPLRPGFPPGRRKRPVHEIDEVLAECHRLALYAERVDTS